MDKLYIIIPAYNEEENIESVVREWHDVAVKTGLESRLVIIDDGSKDGTYAKLQELQKEAHQLVAITKPNGGHGATVLWGYHYALDNNADYIFQTDSDGQTIPKEFWGFWGNRKDFDYVIGYRHSREDGLSRMFVTKILRLVLFLCFHVWVKDANTPFRLMSAESLKRCIQSIPDAYFLANAVLSVVYTKLSYRVLYLPITFRQRQGGNNTINISKIIKIGIRAISEFVSINEKINQK